MDWRPVVDFLFPAQCAGCGLLGSGLCDACAKGRPEKVFIKGLSISAYGAYEGVLRSAILALKDGRRDVAEALGARVAPTIDAAAILVPVPTSKKRLRVRGIDGVALVARGAAASCGCRVLEVLTQRAGDAQRGRTGEQRRAARGRFACDESVRGKSVTLIDDVCTTGATLLDCARAIRAAGGEVARAVVVALTKSAP